VLIDRTHRPWLLAAGVLLALGAVSYIVYALLAVGGPSGGSVPGLIFGTIGSAMMLYAGLLGLRKKFPIWRVGRATSWMRGHLWLGTLSFPYILFHAAFRLGSGMLTRTLMVLFITVFLSGIAGAALQHFLPRLMTERLPMETIFEQIERVRKQLTEEAALLINDVVGALEGDLAKAGQAQRIMAANAGTRGNMTVASALGADDQVGVTVKNFFTSDLEPFLMHSGGGRSPLARTEKAASIFSQLRILIPKTLWPKLDDLENICEEKRQLDRQKRMHRILHGWLLVHIPASYALLLLGAVHAVVALRY
jgi:hypothetical protein